MAPTRRPHGIVVSDSSSSGASHVLSPASKSQAFQWCGGTLLPQMQRKSLVSVEHIYISYMSQKLSVSYLMHYGWNTRLLIVYSLSVWLLMSRNGSEERDCAQIQLGTYHLITLRYSRAKEIGGKKTFQEISLFQLCLTPVITDCLEITLDHQTSDEGPLRFSGSYPSHGDHLRITHGDPFKPWLPCLVQFLQ